PKAGTTSLDHYLRQHPQIFMSPKKEPHFFCFENGLPRFTGPHDDQVWRELAVTDLAAYQALFREGLSCAARGEASTNYLYYHAVAAPNIKAYLPDVRLIAVLRNPADRAFSAYQHRRRDFRDPAPTFEAALALEDERIAQGWEPGAHYFRGGLYAAALKTYYAHFDPSQIRVYIYEQDIERDLANTLRDIFRFLQVDEQSPIDVSDRLNASGVIQSRWLRALRWLALYTDVVKGVKRILPPALVEPARRRFRQTQQASAKRETIPPETRRRLLEHYREDIMQTQALIGRDLRSWLDTP
ncbi:MAG: sulfotransferase, partial [Anaerolineae bacterium]|nr:sulfotransferase [Anaerolineae bacterium]